MPDAGAAYPAPHRDRHDLRVARLTKLPGAAGESSELAEGMGDDAGALLSSAFSMQAWTDSSFSKYSS